jgi:FdhE protein
LFSSVNSSVIFAAAVSDTLIIDFSYGWLHYTIGAPMPFVALAPATRESRLVVAAARWAAILEARPDLAPAVTLQRRLIGLVVDLTETLEHARLPKLSLPPKYLAAKLARGVPVLAGEPIPLPVVALKPTLLRLCEELSHGGAGEASDHIRSALLEKRLDSGSLLTASLAREQAAIRVGAAQLGLAADLLWLVAELAVSPFAHTLLLTLLAPATEDEALAGALEGWRAGYCPACGSWPALAEVTRERRVLRCSFCALAWQSNPASCIYCADRVESLGPRAPGAGPPVRSVEICLSCKGYLKTLAADELLPFPLIAIADMETMDLDLMAMERGGSRPALRKFTIRS